MKKNVIILDAGDASQLSAFDAAQRIAFQEPKKTSRDSCVCQAVMLSSKANATAKSMVLNVPSARLLRTLKNKDSITLVVKVPKCVQRLLLNLDGHCLSSAVQQSDKWFMHNINASLIEDFFKGSVEVDCMTGSTVARFKLHLGDEDALQPTMAVDRDYSLSLKFVGLHFRKQHFAALWKLVMADDVTVPDIDIIHDDEYDDTDDEDEKLICPLPQDMVDMAAEMRERVTVLHDHHVAVASRLSELAQRLSIATMTMADFNEVSDALAELCSANDDSDL